MTISRRAALTGALTESVAAAARGSAKAQATKLEPTGQETLGPFYPVRAPVSHDLDLTRYPGRQGRALGQVIQLTGRVLDTSGRPLPQASVTVWQANAAGRYTNPVDDNPAPLDPNFLGAVSFKVGSDGSYRLRTLNRALIRSGLGPSGHRMSISMSPTPTTGWSPRCISPARN